MFGLNKEILEKLGFYEKSKSRLFDEDSLNSFSDNVDFKESLSFSEFNEAITKKSYFVLDPTFNDSLTNEYIEKNLPEYVTHLHLGIYFNQPLTKGVIPKRITHLRLSSFYNQPLKPGDIPDSVIYLDLGDYFNQPLKPGDIPNSVKGLRLSRMYEMYIKKGSLPESLIDLDLNNYNIKIVKNDLPSSLLSIKFGMYYNRPLGNTIPDKVKYVFLSYYFDEMISEENIPESVTNIMMYNEKKIPCFFRKQSK